MKKIVSCADLLLVITACKAEIDDQMTQEAFKKLVAQSELRIFVKREDNVLFQVKNPCDQYFGCVEKNGNPIKYFSFDSMKDLTTLEKQYYGAVIKWGVMRAQYTITKPRY